MSAIKLSVIIPAYNAEKTVVSSLDSLLAQTVGNMEVIVIDDGSTDNTATILDDFAAKDNRIKVLHTSNGGQAVARNRGLEIARGRYIGFMDADDLLEVDDLLEHYVDYLDSHPQTDAVQFPALWKSQNGVTLKGKFNRVLTGQRDLAMSVLGFELTGIVWDKIYRREIFDKIQFAPGRFFEDTWLVLDMIAHIDRLDLCSYGYYTYLIHEGSEMNSKYSAVKWEHRLERNLRFLDLFTPEEKVVALYGEHYNNILNILIQASKEYGYDRFERYALKISLRIPPVSILRKKGVPRAMLYKIPLMKILGMKNFIRLKSGSNKRVKN